MSKQEAAPVVAEQKVESVKIGDKTIKFIDALPLTVGDWKKLKLKGVSLETLRGGDDPDTVSALVLHALKKLDSDITMEDVDSLTRREVDKIAGRIIGYDAEVDRGFLK